jgi:hypothetical protein
MVQCKKERVQGKRNKERQAERKISEEREAKAVK